MKAALLIDSFESVRLGKNFGITAAKPPIFRKGAGKAKTTGVCISRCTVHESVRDAASVVGLPDFGAGCYARRAPKRTIKPVLIDTART